MTRVLLLQLDGKLPNLALMRIAYHHRDRGDTVELRRAGNMQALQRRLGEDEPDLVYASTIFERTRTLAEEVHRVYPAANIGGTGWDIERTVAAVGVNPDGPIDYTDYPRWKPSLGFTQRGCRLKCSFCVVPRKEGSVRASMTIPDIWRGDPWPRHLLLLDNDFFGNPDWPQRIEEIRDGQFKVSFNQGINARMLTDETASAIASVDYRDDGMTVKRIYTAWDNRRDEQRLFAGLEALVRHGVKPDHIMVYMLIGYWPGETADDREYRRAQLRSFGCRPYPMPYRRDRELVGFQRWVIGAYDKTIPWSEWSLARHEPRNLTRISGVVNGRLFS